MNIMSALKLDKPAVPRSVNKLAVRIYPAVIHSSLHFLRDRNSRPDHNTSVFIAQFGDLPPELSLIIIFFESIFLVSFIWIRIIVIFLYSHYHKPHGVNDTVAYHGACQIPLFLQEGKRQAEQNTS